MSLTLREGFDLLKHDILANKAEMGPFSTITVAVFRLGTIGHHCTGPVAKIFRVVYTLLDYFWVKGIIGSDLPATILIGRGLRLGHGGRGIFVHPDVVIGADVRLRQQVTLGVRNPHVGCPVIGDRATLSTKCSVLGPVRVGDDVVVGAHALVIKDVPAGLAAMGVPAVNRPRGLSQHLVASGD